MSCRGHSQEMPIDQHLLAMTTRMSYQRAYYYNNTPIKTNCQVSE